MGDILPSSDITQTWRYASSYMKFESGKFKKFDEVLNIFTESQKIDGLTVATSAGTVCQNNEQVGS